MNFRDSGNSKENAPEAANASIVVDGATNDNDEAAG